MAELGYVGLGVMGSAIVRRLLDAGHEVSVWNRTAEKAGPLLEAGARWADTPRAVTERSEIVFTMVTNTEAVRAVTDGEDGILAGLAPGKALRRHVDREPGEHARARGAGRRDRRRDARRAGLRDVDHGRAWQGISSWSVARRRVRARRSRCSRRSGRV